MLYLKDANQDGRIADTFDEHPGQALPVYFPTQLREMMPTEQHSAG